MQGSLKQQTCDFFAMKMPCSHAFAHQRVPVSSASRRAGPLATTHGRLSWQSSPGTSHAWEKASTLKARHDGSPFCKRRDKSLPGSKMPARACLYQMGGGWDWYGKVRHAPATNQKAGMCWLCGARPDTGKTMGPAERLATDWMHVADEGVTATAAGSILVHVLPRYEGRNQAERCQSLSSTDKTYTKPADTAPPEIQAQGFHEATEAFRLGCGGA